MLTSCSFSQLAFCGTDIAFLDSFSDFGVNSVGKLFFKSLNFVKQKVYLNQRVSFKN